MMQLFIKNVKKKHFKQNENKGETGEITFIFVFIYFKFVHITDTHAHDHTHHQSIKLGDRYRTDGSRQTVGRGRQRERVQSKKSKKKTLTGRLRFQFNSNLDYSKFLIDYKLKKNCFMVIGFNLASYYIFWSVWNFFN